MNQKEIVLVRFPFSNQTDYKIRPAVIVSNDYYNRVHSNFWLVPLTTKQSLKEFELELPQKEIISGKIREKSFARTDVIAAVENDLVLKELGKVSTAFFELLKKQLLKNL